MSQPRSPVRHALGRFAVVGAALVALVAAGAGIASAHVTVSSPNAKPDGYGTLVFNVPNESDTAATTRVQIQMPPKTPFASVLVQPVAGWTVTTTSMTLPTPIKNDDGSQIDSAISVVDFQATAGGIPPGQFQQFTLSVGPFPKASSMAFSAIQTYSDGTEVDWIEPTVAGQPEPEHPAPVLQLTGTSAAVAAQASPDTTVVSSGSGSGNDALTLFLAIAALVLGLAGVVLGWRAHRRTVRS